MFPHCPGATDLGHRKVLFGFPSRLVIRVDSLSNLRKAIILVKAEASCRPQWNLNFSGGKLHCSANSLSKLETAKLFLKSEFRVVLVNDMMIDVVFGLIIFLA